MAVVAIQPQLPETIKNDNRDVSELWRNALKEYKGIVGFDLEKKFDDLDAMVAFGVNEMNSFHKFRHNEKKVDKLRSLFSANVQYLQLGTQQLALAAVPAFPPAAAIGTAVTYMLAACRQVSADYDIVVAFFEDMNSFLQRIVILETRMPKYKAYKNCLMDVFTSFLTMCGYAHKYIELGRFKKWVQNMINMGQDDELGSARKNMDTVLSRLQNATEFAILGNTEELQRMNLELQENQQSHTKLLQEQREVLGTLQDTTEHIRGDMKKLLEAFNEQKKERGDKKQSATDKDKPPSAKRIRNLLPEVESETHEYHILKETLVEDTCAWVFSEPQWDEWMKNEVESQPLLAITGEPGMGKSHIAATVFDKLWKHASEDPDKLTCAASFYFREQHQSLSKFINAIVTVINQVVEQSAPLCELINAQYQKDDISIDIWKWEDLVSYLLGPAFCKGSKYHLYLVLDGVDELSSIDLFTAFLKMVKEQGLRISLVLSARSEILPKISEHDSVLEIMLNKEKQMFDIKSLAWNRLNSLGNLRKFSRYVKQRIADKTLEASPHMLYAEHLLLNFDALGREGAVLRSLDKPMPPTLHELYESLLETTHRRIALTHQQLIKTVLHLVAFSFRPLVLHEVNSLLDYLTDTKDFDIEDVLQPLSSFIRAGDPGADAEARAKVNSRGGWQTTVEDLEKTGASSPDKVYSDASLPIKFRERSMRSFFRTSPTTECTLHWSPSEAHRQLFLMMAKLATPVNNGNAEELGVRVKKYCTHYSLQHWREINPGEHTLTEQAEVLEAFWGMMTNQTNFVAMIEWNGSLYSTILPDEAIQRVSEWAKLVGSVKELEINQAAAEWWTELGERPRDVFLPLARAHVERLYKAIGLTQALVSFRGLKNAVEASYYVKFLTQKAAEVFPESWKEITEDKALEKSTDEQIIDEKTSKEKALAEAPSQTEMMSLSEKEAVLGTVHLFDREMPGPAFRALAELLLKFKHREPAASMCAKALESIQDSPLEKFKALSLMAKIQSKRGHVNKAYEYVNKYAISEYLDSENIPGDLKRAALVTKARVEAKKGDQNSAIRSFSDAKLADPLKLTPGDVLEEELKLYADDDDKTAYFNTLKGWTALERLTWMAWKYEDDGPERHAVLRDYAVQAGEAAFVIQAYEEAIKYLDNVNAGAPLRCDLALVHIQVCDDREQGRKVLDEVFDSGSTGWPYAVTQELPDSTLERAINIQSDLFFSLFRKSTDPVVKKELLKATHGLITRPLALDVPPQSDTWLIPYRLTGTRMVLKMGPAADFQKRMNEDIDACIEGLRDKVGWNDSFNLVLLAKALFILASAIPAGPVRDELKRMSDIFSSARFSRLSSKEDSDESDSDYDSDSEDGSDSEVDEDEDKWEDEEFNGEGDGDDANGDEGDDIENEDEPQNNENESKEDNASTCSSEPPTNEGDLAPPSDAEWSCDGSCNPPVDFYYWSTHTAYQCYTCDVFLCPACYAKRTASAILSGRQYCGQDHEFAKCPVDGWRGVKDGRVMLEGEEGFVFENLLTYVREELCGKAWGCFWAGA